jgi:hypothetical protein
MKNGIGSMLFYDESFGGCEESTSIVWPNHRSPEEMKYRELQFLRPSILFGGDGVEVCRRVTDTAANVSVPFGSYIPHQAPELAVAP